MENKACKDPFGNEFSSIAKLLEYHNIARTVYYRYLKNGLSVDDIVLNCSRQNTVHTDHLGNTFKNQTEMLNHYNISWSVYNYGIKRGYSLERILTRNRHLSTDHTGKKFKTFKEMCDHWKISKNSVKRRLKDGWSIEKALTEPQHRVFVFPKIIYSDDVKARLSVKKLISDEYFLCKFDNHDIILTKTHIIEIANDIIKQKNTTSVT